MKYSTKWFKWARVVVLLTSKESFFYKPAPYLITPSYTSKTEWDNYTNTDLTRLARRWMRREALFFFNRFLVTHFIRRD